MQYINLANLLTFAYTNQGLAIAFSTIFTSLENCYAIDDEEALTRCVEKVWALLAWRLGDLKMEAESIKEFTAAYEAIDTSLEK